MQDRMPGTVHVGGVAGPASARAAVRSGPAATPIWLQGSFRLLFVGGAAWAVIVVLLWLGALGGRWTLPTAMDAARPGISTKCCSAISVRSSPAF